MGGLCLPLSHRPSFRHHVTTEEEGVQDVFFSAFCWKFVPSLLSYVTLNGGSLTDGHHNSPWCLERERAVRQPIMPLISSSVSINPILVWSFWRPQFLEIIFALQYPLFERIDKHAVIKGGGRIYCCYWCTYTNKRYIQLYYILFYSCLLG